MSDTAIKVENLSKRYRIGPAQQQHDTLRDALMDAVKSPIERLRRDGHEDGRDDEIWALRDVSFEVGRGEVVGVIGANGAGKSTLLKILSRITQPTEGRAVINGRVGSLLEVGTGFHPELTGRENIYLNGAILGMTRAEIERKYDEIVNFSGVEKFIDTPVKRYSSGMRVRLAFSVAAHLDPEILLIDEVLAVGDHSFQERCLNKMDDVARTGRTVVFVSHNMSAIANLTQRALVLEAGKTVFAGDSSGAVDFYLGEYRSSLVNTFMPERATAMGGEQARIVDCQLSTSVPQTGEPLGIAVRIERPSSAPELECDLSVSFLTVQGARVFQLYSAHMGRIFSIGPGMSEIRVQISSLPLVPGDYKVNLWLGTGHLAVHWLKDCMTLRVLQGTLDGDRVVEPRGYPVVVPSSWSMVERVGR